MCTLTYLPFGPDGFLLTHSRDEKAVRSAAYPPRPVRISEQEVTFPQDPQGKGTWIASGERTGSGHLTACLLNGGFVPHQPKPLYKYSRGLVILHLFTYPTIKAFTNEYNFCDIEPFTLILTEAGRLPGQRLVELRWNGYRLFIHDKDPNRAHIWSSVTLYTPDVIEKRERWFKTWLMQHPQPSVAEVRGFHQSAGDGDPENALRMNRRGELFTLSLTSVVHDGQQTEMIYEGFVENTLTHQTITPTYAIA